MARLFILSGEHLGQTHDLTGPSNLGRGQDADVVIRGRSVSRLHARLEKSADGQWVLTDLGSSNGTRVRGQHLDGPCTLVDGETFHLGDVEVRLRLDEPAAAAPEPVPSPGPASSPKSGGPELEGDWDASAQAPQAPIQRPAAAPISQARPAPGAASLSASNARRVQAMGATAPGAAGRTAAGGKVLQYKKVENRSGLFSTDLGQQPLLVRTLLYLLLAAAFCGLLWGVYQMTAELRRMDGTISETE